MSRRPAASSPPARPLPGKAAGPAAVVLAAVLDAACILGFAAAGRSTHARDGGVLGVLGTAWPFLVAAAVGWVLVRAWRSPQRPWPTGVAVWAVAWLGGLGLRAATGDGTATAFVVVAGLVLGALLVGWRGVALVVDARLVHGMALNPARRRRRPVGSAPGR